MGYQHRVYKEPYYHTRSREILQQQEIEGEPEATDTVVQLATASIPPAMSLAGSINNLIPSTIVPFPDRENPWTSQIAYAPAISLGKRDATQNANTIGTSSFLILNTR